MIVTLIVTCVLLFTMLLVKSHRESAEKSKISCMTLPRQEVVVDPVKLEEEQNPEEEEEDDARPPTATKEGTRKKGARVSQKDDIEGRFMIEKQNAK